MACLKASLIVSTLILISGCASNYSRFGNPTLEQVLIEHAEKVQSLPTPDEELTEQEKERLRLNKMYKDWVKMKPKLEKLIALEYNLQEIAKLASPKTTNGTSQPQQATVKTNYKTNYKSKVKYYMQIGASKTEALANKFWQSQKQKHLKIFSNMTHHIEHIERSGKSFYRVKVGSFETIKQAKLVCKEYKREKGQCIIRKSE